MADLCRTFMFMPSTDYRPGYGEARKKVYKGIFAEDEFPPNSGIYIRDLGPQYLLRSVAVAYRERKQSLPAPRSKSAGVLFRNRCEWVIGCCLPVSDDHSLQPEEVEAEGDLAGKRK